MPRALTPPRVLSNRGANGIDGTVATAYGVAAAAGGPVALLIGDVALAHDVGSLLTARRSGIPLTIVLVDNGGGGIFDFLPVATQTDAFEAHVATPTKIDFAGVAQAFGLHHLAVATLEEFRAALDHGLTSDGTQMIHVAQLTQRERRAAPKGLGRRRIRARLTLLSPRAREAAPASFTSVSASSAAGSESRTTPTPA